MKFNVVLADPPWDFKTYSDKGSDKSPLQHYNTMTVDDISKIDVKSIISNRACLFLWCLDTHIEDMFPLIRKWGFIYKSFAFTWYKLRKDIDGAVKEIFGSYENITNKRSDISKLFRMGMGYNSRKQTEICLFATTETPPTRIDCGVRQALTASDDIFAPTSRHSAKPKDQYRRIERLYEGPYIELFARETREGWTSLGNEIDGLDINDAIRKLNGKST